MTNDGTPMPPCACLRCGELLDMAMDLTGDRKPCANSKTICINCGHVMAFTLDLKLRDLSANESSAAAHNIQIRHVQQLVAIRMRSKQR
jgi:hypothetical protein